MKHKTLPPAKKAKAKRLAMSSFVQRTLVSGLVAGTTAALAASLAARRQGSSYPSALNATSHIAWGGEAARQDAWTAKYTGLGAFLHFGSAVFWAALYEVLPGPAPVRAVATAATAYAVDYHVVPPRLTPGWEKRMSGGALGAVYVALALGLLLGSAPKTRFG